MLIGYRYHSLFCDLFYFCVFVLSYLRDLLWFIDPNSSWLFQRRCGCLSASEVSLEYRAKSANHYSDVIMGSIVSQITSLTIVYSSVYSDADQRKHQSSASLAFVRGIHRRAVNSPHKGPVTREMFPFDDVIMASTQQNITKREP